VPVWGDHTIGPRTAKKVHYYCTCILCSAHGNFVQRVNLQNRRRTSSSCSYYPFYVNSRAVAGSGSRSCTDNTSNWPVLKQILQFFPFCNFSSPLHSSFEKGSRASPAFLRPFGNWYKSGTKHFRLTILIERNPQGGFQWKITTLPNMAWKLFELRVFRVCGWSPPPRGREMENY